MIQSLAFNPCRTWLGAHVASLVLVLAMTAARSQDGPFPPDAWPTSADGNKLVHFTTADFSMDGLGAGWEETLTVLSGGDQQTTPINIGGFEGLKATSNYLNIADLDYEPWEDHEFIDILVQVYGNAAVLDAGGNPRNFNFLTGTLPELNSPSGGSIPVEAKNNQWNWVLFRVPNDERPSGEGRYVGTVPDDAQGGIAAGGVNGGTIRFQGVPQLIVRAIAFGEEGAFGELDQINRFTSAEACSDEPETNHAFVDIHAGSAEHLEIMDGGDQAVELAENIGPADDKRSAVRAVDSYLNFGVTEDYLGSSCNDPRTVKICLEFYDDPALAGSAFGPDAYATDGQGGIGTFAPDDWKATRGTGRWVSQAYIVPAVSLFGINAGDYTAGPRIAFDAGANFYISRFDLAIMRTGEHPLAGQDPLADCYLDPAVCAGDYGNYAEMDLGSGLFDGLMQGNSGGDQEMIEELAGPAGDRRMAIRAAREDGTAGFPHQYLNLAITEEPFGPSEQPNARLAVCVTYWDNPDEVDATFRPEVYRSDVGGVESFAFMPADANVALEGTDSWREAYFEIPDIKFSGVNQGPQAGARFIMSGKVHITRVRYAVIRECGLTAGVNPLANCLSEGEGEGVFEINDFSQTESEVAFSFVTPNTNHTHDLEQSQDLVIWTPSEGAVLGQGDGDLSFTAPRSEGLTLFYRVARTPPPALYSEDFETAPNDWTTSTESGDTDWELGTPAVADLAMAHSGVNAYGTNLDGDYGNGVVTSLRSPVIDVTALGRPQLTFWYYVDTVEGTEGVQLRFYSENGDRLTEREGILWGQTAGWTEFSEVLPLEARSQKIQLEWTLLSNESEPNGAGFYLDDVVVE
ncbi:MAG: hypothetical protein ACI8T1_002983 [Verrucomicrobiales bacterium]|jgi:hypothetical protein